MAIFSITNKSKQSVPPTQVGDIKFFLNSGESFSFSRSFFTTETSPKYSHPTGAAVSKLKVDNLALTSGYSFEHNGASVSIGDEIDMADVDNKLLVLTDDGANLVDQTLTMRFLLSDVESNQFSTASGVVRCSTVAVLSQPPTIGDNDVDLSYGETLVFTRAMFTTATTPAYSDPEGDSADKLKITSLPSSSGTVLSGSDGLKLNGRPVAIGDIIDFADIDAGLLTYSSSNDGSSDTNVDFNFEIADSGSGLFSS